ncbi:MAG TPA: hypothetical protein VJJ52_01465 [Candidatus Nanoarchaeia archaeon]|nr:hypothetical protein [Candidatus Nanoarchaeia archaeon]
MADQVSKLKKKQWYNIFAPQQFENTLIGETLVADPRSMLGKTLSHNLMNLTSDPKRQNINIRFKVVEVDGDKGKTKIIGYEIIPSSVKRFVRRNSEKMDLSFACETADGVTLRVKPLVITKADVKGSIAAKMRNSIVQHLIKTIKKMNYNDVLNEVITHKMQASVKEVFNKMYPLKVCEIRYLGIEQREKTQEAQVEPKAEEVKVETVTEVTEEVRAESAAETAEKL